MHSEQIRSLAHRRQKTECRWRFSARLFHAANTDVQRNAALHWGDAHHFGEKFAGAMPGRRSRICKRNFQLISARVLALTAKAHALRRNVDGHSLFKPGNPFRITADRNCEGLAQAASPFVFTTMRISVVIRALLSFQLDRDSKGRGDIVDADGARELAQFRGKLPPRLALGLISFWRFRSTNRSEP